MCYIGLDAGTSGIKALAFDEKGNVLASSHFHYPLITPRDGWSELSPEDIWNGARHVLANVAAQLNCPVRAIAVSSTGQAVVPIDAKGRPLYRFITTVDARTDAQNRWWREHMDEKEMFSRTGLPFSPIYTVNKIMWLREHEPEIFRKTWKFLCVEDYLNWKLSGETVIDYSVASRGMLLDIRSFQWDDTILQIAGIRPSQLSQLARATAHLGKIRRELAEELHLPASADIIVGSHDQTCGTIGCGTIRTGETMNATGTVEVLMVVKDGLPDPDGVLRCHFPCIPHVIEGKYSIMSINQNAGVLLKWYKNLFCQAEWDYAVGQQLDPYRYIIESSSNQAADVFVLPHINGCETPISDPVSSAAIVGMRAHHTKADITRAILDSMAYDLRQNIEALSNIGISIDTIHAIGGGAKTGKLLQLKADCTQKIIRTPAVTEAASLGAAILAAVGAGAYPDVETAVQNMVRMGTAYYPNEKNREAYDRGYQVFCSLYDHLKAINHGIRRA